MGLLLSEFESCDALVIGTPVYYRNVTVQLKALFDRSFVFKNRKLFEGKLEEALAVGRGEGMIFPLHGRNNRCILWLHV